jgi:hypothetical protein
VRTERAIVLRATDTVGPTRLQLLTAASTKLPVVVVDQTAEPTAYHVFDVGTVQAALANVLSATSLSETIAVDGRSRREPLSMAQVPTAESGRPVVDNGRLLGVTASDKPEYPEPTEADMARAGSEDSAAGGRKRGFWRRRGKSDG